MSLEGADRAACLCSMLVAAQSACYSVNHAAAAAAAAAAAYQRLMPLPMHLLCNDKHTLLIGSPLPKVTPPPAPVAAKLSWVPAEVIKCYAYKAAEMRVRVLQLVDDILLPARETERVRAVGLCSIWQQLDEPGKRGLRAMLDSRKQCQGKQKHSYLLMQCILVYTMCSSF
jgi:hypothetical protein